MAVQTEAWHPETLFLVGALGFQLGTSRQVDHGVARDAFARSSRLSLLAVRHKLLSATASYAKFLGLRHDDLAARAHQQALLSLRSTGLTGEAFALLADAGCRPLVIKGAALAVLTQGSVASRGPGDIDIVVAPSSVPSAVAALKGDGAVLQSASHVGWRMHAVNLQWRGAAIDLHHRLDHSTDVGAPFEELWNRRQQVNLGGRDVDTLSLVDTAVYNAVHAGRDIWSQLGRMGDSYRLLSAFPDHELLMAVAREWRATRLMELAFAVVRRLEPTIPSQRPLAEALAQQVWLWLAAGRQLRFGQDSRSKVERELFRMAAVAHPRYAAWVVMRNAVRPWDLVRPWQGD